MDKGKSLQQMVLENWMSYAKKKKQKFLKVGPLPQRKNQSEDLNARTKTIKLLEENIGGNLNDIGFGNASLDMI